MEKLKGGLPYLMNLKEEVPFYGRAGAILACAESATMGYIRGVMSCSMSISNLQCVCNNGLGTWFDVLQPVCMYVAA